MTLIVSRYSGSFLCALTSFQRSCWTCFKHFSQQQKHSIPFLNLCEHSHILKVLKLNAVYGGSSFLRNAKIKFSKNMPFFIYTAHVSYIIQFYRQFVIPNSCFYFDTLSKKKGKNSLQLAIHLCLSSAEWCEVSQKVKNISQKTYLNI